jgi:hypothetical protein
MSYFFTGAAIVSSLASAGLTAYSASQQADAQKKATAYQAQVAANNAKIAGYQRSAALQQGEQEAQQSMLQRAQMLGKQRAALAANGVDLNSGSAIDLLASTEFLGEQDVNQIQNNAVRKAWGYEVEGSNYQAQSNLDQWKADTTNPTAIGAMAGTTSLLSSASMFAMSRIGGGSSGSSNSGSKKS